MLHTPGIRGAAGSSGDARERSEVEFAGGGGGGSLFKANALNEEEGGGESGAVSYTETMYILCTYYKEEQVRTPILHTLERASAEGESV